MQILLQMSSDTSSQTTTADSIFGPLAIEYFGVDIPDVDESWYDMFKEASESIDHAIRIINKKYKGKTIYPLPQNVFRCFKLVSLHKVKVIIVGQDPYYTPENATGIAFSGGKESVIPKSLANIIREIGKSYPFSSKDGFPEPKSGCIEGWCDQGVMLINNSFTVNEGEPKSHGGIWRGFLGYFVNKIIDHNANIPWLLWGAEAKGLKDSRMMKRANHVLEAGHPSPFSYKYFKDCNHFYLCNEILLSHAEIPIEWRKMEPKKEEREIV